jgi:hypothetical protein
MRGFSGIAEEPLASQEALCVVMLTQKATTTPENNIAMYK